MNYSIKIVKFLCLDAPYQRTLLHYCKTILRRNETAILSLNLTVPEVVNYMNVTVRVDYKFSTYRPFLFDAQVEGCEFLRTKTRDPASEMVYKNIFENLPDFATPCPHGNRSYYVNHWLETKNLPASVPAGDYRLTTTFAFKDGVTIIKIQTFLIKSSQQEAKFTIRITKFVCLDMPYQRTLVHHCRTILRRNQPTMLSLYATVPEVVNYMNVTVVVEYKFSTYRPFLFDTQVEGCEFLRTKTRDPASEMVYKNVFQNLPDFMQPCPHGNRSYRINYWMESKNLPASVPAGDYRITTTFTFKDGVTIIKIASYLTVRKKGIFRSMIEW
uniref:Uncharacterized protein n=1 Tax=Anopheles albimanus TaxID=7167 RepID=A0A182FBK0_ANOAL